MPPAKKSSARKAPTKKTTTSAAARRNRQQRESRALRNRILTAGALLVVAGMVVFFAARPKPDNVGPDGASVPEQLKPCRYDEKSDGTAQTERSHVTNPTYLVNPPDAGPHFPQPANPGFYQGKNVPTDGELVHAQEHGFVVLWFKSGLSDAKMKQIQDLSDQFGRELIVVERPSLTDEVAITAWHHRALCAQLDPSKVELFTKAYNDQGPEKGFL